MNQKTLLCSAALAACIPFLSAETVGNFTVSTDIAMIGSTDVDLPDTDSSFDGVEVGVAASISSLTDGKHYLELSFDSTTREYEWDGAGFDFGAGLVGVPYDEVQIFNIGVSGRTMYSQEFGAFAGINMTLAQAEGTFTDSSFSDGEALGGMIGLIYAPSRDLMVSFGVMAQERLEDSERILPIIAVRW